MGRVVSVSPEPGMPQDTSFPSANDADLLLLRQMADGLTEALGLFYDRHASLTLGLLCRMLRNRDEAEEVLQEVFLQAWRDARRYDPARSSPRGWLLLIARSRALDRRARQQTGATSYFTNRLRPSSLVSDFTP
jgi:RNA polymerase sigma-70 factor, ECF subfamily